MAAYVPRQGDIIAITFDPQTGHEQKGRRPAFVVSKDLFNRSTGLAIVCPVTNTERGFPFHVPIPKDSRLTGFIMVEQVKSVDFRARRAKRIEDGNDELLDEVLWPYWMPASINRPTTVCSRPPGPSGEWGRPIPHVPIKPSSAMTNSR